MKAYWKSIPGHENYQVSSFGKIRNKYKKLRKLNKSGSGYLMIDLWSDGERKAYSVHQLVAMAFLNHEPNGMTLVIDHINGDKTDNRVENLRIITQRENTYTHHDGASNFKGVSWDKDKNKWRARIHINGKGKHLGYFLDEENAARAYESALLKIITIKVV